jgi:hypothetical protein
MWKVASPHVDDTLVPSIPPLLDADAQRRGFAVEMRVFRAKDFASAFFAARIIPSTS